MFINGICIYDCNYFNFLKVLVVSDIKVALGYRMSAGHRSWRNVGDIIEG